METTPDELWSPDAVDPYNLVPDLAAMLDTIQAALLARTPTGVINPYGGTTSPAGWLICDGSAISRTEYAALFAIFGTSQGVGDGTTTFNLPDLRGKVIVGVDSGQTEFSPLGKTGGAKTHTLTRAQMPNIAGAFGALVPDNHVESRTGDFQAVTIATSHPTAKNVPAATGNIYGYSLNVGGGGAHNNLQPYLSLNYIVKV